MKTERPVAVLGISVEMLSDLLDLPDDAEIKGAAISESLGIVGLLIESQEAFPPAPISEKPPVAEAHYEGYPYPGGIELASLEVTDEEFPRFFGVQYMRRLLALEEEIERLEGILKQVDEARRGSRDLEEFWERVKDEVLSVEVTPS